MIAAQAANLVFRAEIDGLRKYSPPRGTTNSFGKVSEAVTFCGSNPEIVLGSLTFCPVCSVVSERQLYNMITHNKVKPSTRLREYGIVGPSWSMFRYNFTK